jgi:ribonucleotide monophosphatase NagD (HAD superfamily)
MKKFCLEYKYIMTNKTLLLFDVDGTLTLPKAAIRLS